MPKRYQSTHLEYPFFSIISGLNTPLTHKKIWYNLTIPSLHKPKSVIFTLSGFKSLRILTEFIEFEFAQLLEFDPETMKNFINYYLILIINLKIKI